MPATCGALSLADRTVKDGKRRQHPSGPQGTPQEGRFVMHRAGRQPSRPDASGPSRAPGQQMHF